MGGVMDVFSSSSEEDKQAAFEQSTLTLVLKQLGATDGYIRAQQRDREDAYTFDWFNQEFAFNAVVLARRCFRFSVEDIFRRPSKSPIVKLYREVSSEYEEELHSTHLVLVFKAYELGRLVLTTMPLEDRTYVCVDTGGVRFNVTTFAGFFREQFGTFLEDL